MTTHEPGTGPDPGGRPARPWSPWVWGAIIGIGIGLAFVPSLGPVGIGIGIALAPSSAPGTTGTTTTGTTEHRSDDRPDDTAPDQPGTPDTPDQDQ